MLRDRNATRPLIFNGLDRRTGEYLLPPMSVQELSEHLRAGTVDLRGEPRGEPVPGVDPKDLSTSGWGVIFPRDAGEEIREALSELLEHRRAQATKCDDHDDHYYQEYSGSRGFLPGDLKRTWLKRRGVGPGPADPARVPYYLLIVGDPQEIPYEFQFRLSLQYAVGRLHFDAPEEYARYAHRVVAAENAPPTRPRRLAIFGVENPDDPATTYSSEDLVRPLLRNLAADGGGWEVSSFLAAEATKDRLRRLLGGAETPALVFTAGHGLGLCAEDPEPPGTLGALVCQDWPGPKAGGPLGPEHYFAAEDVAGDAELGGLISFHFACFSAGLPRCDSYVCESPGQPAVLSPRPYLARLPQRLLGRGALAVIGHVDRARGFSYVWPGAGSQPQTIEATLRRLMDGFPVGTAVRYLSERSADLACDLDAELRRVRDGEPPDHETIVDLGIAYVDARSYLVLGDPAVRLQVRG
ncbi:MAG: hypothetical protein GY856_14790 [bacterium]|nr:hypothetical protein [bacterium]